MCSDSVSLSIGYLFRLMCLMFFVFGFVKATEPTCSQTLLPLYIGLGFLNVCLIGGIIFLSFKIFSSKGNKKEENKKEDKKENEEPKKVKE
uniref:DUF3955 domain-containing protein n=1 Tax=Meloidogyne hapla TaxID=6305 RepID=A0A1I8BBC2_MELHA